MFEIINSKKESSISEEKIFGIGLNKTGTTSLGIALEILGYTNHVSYDLNLIKDWKSGKFNKIHEVGDSNNNFEDWPWPLMYKRLYLRYPNAKFILTTRLSPEVWFRSLEKHAEKTGPTIARKLIYKYYLPTENKKAHIEFYKQHNNQVKAFFEKKDTNKFISICWEKGDSWRKLCGFLNLNIPNSIPFPHLNKSKYTGC